MEQHKTIISVEVTKRTVEALNSLVKPYKRPDFVILPDSTVGFYDRPSPAAANFVTIKHAANNLS